MERLIQILDDFDDLIGSIGLARERIRVTVLGLSTLVLSVILQIAGVLLALRHPPLALAAAILLFVALLYRQVTSPHSTLEIVS